MIKPSQFIVGVSVLALFGCKTTAPESGSVDKELPRIASANYTPLVPNTGVRVGRLYFSGVGKRAAFITPDGVVYNELCYGDYEETPSLAEIDKFVLDKGVSINKKTITGSIVGSMSVSTSKLKKLGTIAINADGNRNRTYIIEKVHKLTLSSEGEKIVRSKIGDDCRAEIKTLSAYQDVILVLSAERAEKATDTRTVSASGRVGASIGGTVSGESGKVTVTGDGIGGGGEITNQVVDEYELVYVSILKDKP